MQTTTLDTHDMVLVHRVFRRELGQLPDLVRAAVGDPVRALRVRGHAEELLALLHHHHSGEDALVWPKLRQRVALEAALVQRMEDQHEAVAALVERIELALVVWQGDAERGEALAAELALLHAALVEHLDEEERSVLPLVARTFTQQEWDELGQRGFAAVPRDRRLVTLAQILQDADDDEKAAFLAHLPVPVRVAYRLLGRRALAKEHAALHVPAPRRG